MDAPTLTGFEPHHRFDFFEPGDKTALVCFDVPEMQRLAIDQLAELGYKIHTGLFMEDSILKLRAHPYNVVLVSEHFNGSSLNEHPLLEDMVRLPPTQRRRQVFVLIGSSLRTNDELQAFARSVDVVISLADVLNLRPVIRRAVNLAAEFYAPFLEAVSTLAGSDSSGRGNQPSLPR